jgi:hypothetical protein
MLSSRTNRTQNRKKVNLKRDSKQGSDPVE